MALPRIDTRLKHNGYLATVRYAGPVDGSQGLWIGVEWDDPERGKHSGSKDGKHYFHCRVDGAGSFVRPSSNIIYGHSFLAALRSKYVEDLHGSSTQEKVTLGSSAGAIEVEAVDLDKIRKKFGRLDRLRQVSLDDENVSQADAPAEIEKTCPNIQGLDLSFNLFPSWQVIAQITKGLPQLQRLAVNRNRLQHPTSLDTLQGAFSSLLELQLNDTLMTWQEMEEITSLMPCLQSVEMGYNRLISLPTHQPRAYNPGIQILNLDGNMLSEWPDICAALKRYPTLQRLILTSNRIKHIPVLMDDGGGQGPLNSIQSLSLAQNPLQGWDSIDALSAWLPSLKTLTLSGSLLGNDHNSRPWIIARIPSLMTLDGASISPKERLDSEIFYLGSIMRENHTTDSERAKAHRQWDALCKKHGRPDDVAPQTVSQDKLKSKLIELKMLDASKLSDTAPAMSSLRVLPTMTLRNLRLKICKGAKADPRKVKIVCKLRMSNGSLSELESEYDTRELDWLGLEEGSEVVYELH